MNAKNYKKTIETTNIERTMEVGAALARQLKSGDIVGLVGELGAGKTQFVRGMASGLGINQRQVSSPTFVLIQEYEPQDSNDLVLVHIDAYRLKKQNEQDSSLATDQALSTIGWENNGKEIRHNAVVAIEWANAIEQELGDEVIWVSMSHSSWREEINSRQIEITTPKNRENLLETI